MNKLKQTLIDNKISQAKLANHLNISTASMSLIINHKKYPKTLSIDAIINNINQFFTNHGIKFTHKIDTKTNKATTPTTKEEELMLLRRQTLTPQAKKAFKILHGNPFTGDVKSADGLYQSEQTAYVREYMFETATSGGFIAVTGESGAGKSTLRHDLIDRLNRSSKGVIVIEPYIVATEDNDIKGKTLKSGHIAEAILHALSPLENPKRSPEARYRQVHNALKESHKAGNRHVLIIEEAHSLPLPTLKHLKRFFELQDGYTKLLGIILIGQNELATKLSENNPRIREVVQRCELITLEPIAPTELKAYLQKRIGDRKIDTIIDDLGIEALINRLVRTDKNGKVTQSLLYPLAIGNLITGAINEASSIGIPLINADLINNV